MARMKFLRGKVRVSKAGLIFVIGYLGSMVAAWLVPAADFLAKILNFPGVEIAKLIHTWGAGQDPAITWLSIFNATTWTSPIPTPVIEGTIALIAIAIVLNIAIYYAVGTVLDK